jgi:hypothetical protein
MSFVVLRTEHEEYNERDIVGLCKSGSMGDSTVVVD